MSRDRIARAREEEALGVVRAGVPHGLELVEGLDPLRDHRGAEILAELDHGAHQDLLARLLSRSHHQLAIELHDVRLQVEHALQIAVAGAEVVHHQMRPGRARRAPPSTLRHRSKYSNAADSVISR